jgi:hypothetical protein
MCENKFYLMECDKLITEGQRLASDMGSWGSCLRPYLCLEPALRAEGTRGTARKVGCLTLEWRSWVGSPMS